MKRENELFLQNAKAKGSVLGLHNMKRLMECLGNVQEQLPIIHIAGTNGKGSVGAYLCSIFTEAGLTVGRYTSPAVFSPMEVFTVDGVCMTEEEYEEMLCRVRLSLEANNVSTEEYPTIFELETAMAFLWFTYKKPDLVLLECGMGGLTDATNVILKPIASVITSISVDHTAFLGETTAEIAAVKAGIMKKDCPVFSASQDKNATSVLLEKANESQTDIIFVDENAIEPCESKPGLLAFFYHTLKDSYSLETQMAGAYQMGNAALAIEVASGLWECLDLVEENRTDNIVDGIYKAYWPGRFEVLRKNPLLIMDGAHNPDAAKQLAATMERCMGRDEKWLLILGVLADKDHKRMLKTLLPLAEKIICVTPDNARALEAADLKIEIEEVIAEQKLDIEVFLSDIEGALVLAKNEASGLPILACGSLSYLGKLRENVDLVFPESDL